MLGKVLKPSVIAGLILVFLFSSMGFAQTGAGVEIRLDGEVLDVEANVRDGRTYVDSDQLADETGLEVDEQPEVALRSFFEDRGAIVVWNSKARVANIYYDVDNYSATELLAASSEAMLAKNTFKMSSEGNIDFEFDTPIEELSWTRDSAGFSLNASFSYDPFEMYMKQGISHNEFGNISMEVAYEDGVSYQRSPLLSGDMWLASEDDADEMMEMMELVNQVDPRVLMQLAEDFGANVYFGDSEEIDGVEYKVVNVELDEGVIEAIIDGMIEDDELADVHRAMLENLDITSYDEYLINSENLVVDYIREDAEVNFSFDGSELEKMMGAELGLDGDVTGYFGISAQSEIYGVGEPIEMPTFRDVVDAEDFVHMVE